MKPKTTAICLILIGTLCSIMSPKNSSAATTLTPARIAHTQEVLRAQNLNGWLLYDFHAYNRVAVQYLGLSGVITRRSWYFIPAEGTPIAFVSAIEKDKFTDLPGEKVVFLGYQRMEDSLRTRLNLLMPPGSTVAMEYSADGRLPYNGYVDAGTVELVRSLGYTIVSSADLVSALDAALSPERRALHMEAARKVIQVKDAAFDFIRERLRAGEPISEWNVCEFIMRSFSEEGLVPDHEPIVAVNGAAGNPHYEPTAEKSNQIKLGDLILIDLWAKHDRPDGVVADISWMAYANRPDENAPPKLYQELFGYVLAAQQAAFDFVRDNFDRGPVYGADADDASRKVITDAGYGNRFTHRTGHSITGDTHGSGPNIDNLETNDTRRLMPGHVFSLEPGIYDADAGWGFRSEINVMITEGGPIITTTPRQTELILLFP